MGRGERIAALTLTPCAEGQVCGRFERVDDNSEHCVYVLLYRLPTSDHFVFISARHQQLRVRIQPVDG